MLPNERGAYPVKMKGEIELENSKRTFVKYFRQNSGNTILVIMLAATLGLASIVFVMQQVGMANKSAISLMQKSEANGKDQSALGLLSEKFKLKGVEQYLLPNQIRAARFYSHGESGVPNTGDQQPFVFVEPYPNLAELNDSNFKPNLMLFRPAPDANQVNPNLKKANGSPINLPLIQVTGKKSPSVGKCETLLNPEVRLTNQLQTEDCSYSYFTLDTSKLFSLEKTKRPSDFHQAYIGFANLMLLDPKSLIDLFSQANFSLPTDAIDSRLVSFLKMIPDPIYPRVLKSMIVRVGNTLAEVSMDMPPEPRALLERSSGGVGAIPLGRQVSLDTKTNSITVSAQLSETSFRTYRSLTVPRQSVRNVQSETFFKQTTETLTVPRDLYTNTALYGTPRINPTNDREGLWTVSLRAQGLRGETSESFLDLTVVPPPKPKCVSSFGSDRFREGGQELLQGEGFTISINCNFPDSGHVDYASIGGIPVTNFDNNPSSPRYKTGSVFYSRRNMVQGETIVVEARGPGGSWSGAEYLNKVCDLNDPQAVAYYSSYFGSWPFSRKYGPLTGVLFSTGESSVLHATHLNPIVEPCSNSSYCTGTFQYLTGIWDQQEIWKYFSQTCSLTDRNRNIHYYECGEWKYGKYGETAWVTPQKYTVQGVELNWEQRKSHVQYYNGSYYFPLFGGNAVLAQIGNKRDANCTIQKYHLRTQGCFVGDTRVTLANGSEKRVADLSEADWVYNPLYQTPVRIKKIVKGPENRPLYEVKAGNRSVRVTEDHPFLTQIGWVRADQLRPNDLLMGEKQPQKVSRVIKVRNKKTTTVYNLELDTEVSEGHLILANGIPSGDLTTQVKLKKETKTLP